MRLSLKRSPAPTAPGVHPEPFWSYRPQSDREAGDAIVSNFLLHWFPAKVYKPSLDWTYSFWLGTVSAALFFLLILSGLPLLFLYVPSVERAYASVKDIEYVVTFGFWIRAVHRLSAHLMVAAVFLHLVRVFLTGAYKNGSGHNQHREWNWLMGVAMLLLTLFLSFTGYLLPWDQLAYWAVTVGTKIASAVPLVGPQIRELLLGGRNIDQPASALDGVTDMLLEAAHLAQVANQRGYRRIAANIRTRHMALAEQLPLGVQEHSALQADIDRLLFEMLDVCQTVASTPNEVLSPEISDRIIGVGEKLAARVIAGLLRNNNLRGVAIDGMDVVITDGVHGNATPLMDATRERINNHLLPMLSRQIVPVVTGFIGATVDGKPTTMGRGELGQGMSHMVGDIKQASSEQSHAAREILTDTAQMKEFMERVKLSTIEQARETRRVADAIFRVLEKISRVSGQITSGDIKMERMRRQKAKRKKRAASKYS